MNAEEPDAPLLTISETPGFYRQHSRFHSDFPETDGQTCLWIKEAECSRLRVKTTSAGVITGH